MQTIEVFAFAVKLHIYRNDRAASVDRTYFLTVKPWFACSENANYSMRQNAVMSLSVAMDLWLSDSS